MRSKCTLIILIFLLVSILPLCAQQQIRPEKEVFKDAASWPQTAPGNIKLKNFRPFRAVYQRSYVQGSGPDAGQPRQDRVIVSAEEVGWDGHAAIHISLIDSGDAKWKDTAARNLFMVIDAEDMHLYFESGPIPGKAKDYYFSRPAKGIGTMVTTDTGKAQTQNFPAGLKGWGPGPWAMASMDLKKGEKIHLGPFATPAGNLFGKRQGIAKGPQKFTDVSGKTHQAWLIETGGNLSNARMGELYIIPEPPYFLASFSRDLDSGKETNGMRLLSFQYLK